MVRSLFLAVVFSCLLPSPPAECQQPPADTPSRQSGLPDAIADEWVYTVRRGDNLWSLAREFLADGQYLEQVRERNHVRDPLTLRPGTRLRIPFAWLKAQPVSATLVAVSGDVRVERSGGAAFAAPAGTSLQRGDAVVAAQAASATVQFADGSKLAIASGSRVVFDTLTEYGPAGMVDTRVRLERGRAWSRVNPGGSRRGRYRLVTPAATAVARGTEFRVEADPASDTTDTETLEGTVRAQNEAGQADVAEGFGVRIQRGAAPSAPAPLLAAPVWEGPLTLTRLPARIDLPAVSGAVSYRVEISADAEFTTYAYEATTANPLRGFGLPDGRYFLRARGIAATGLEGRDAVTSLVIDARPEPPVLMTPPVGEQVGAPRPAFGWTRAADADGYRIQVATDERFAPPLVVDATLPASAHTPTQDLPPGRYFWRVASRAGDEQGPFSDVSSFERRTRPTAPDATSVARADGVVLRWTASGPGARYRYQISGDESFAAIVTEATVATPEATITGLAPGRYHLRIKSIEADGFEGDYGTMQSFEVAQPPRTHRRWPYLVVPAAGALLLLLLM